MLQQTDKKPEKAARTLAELEALPPAQASRIAAHLLSQALREKDPALAENVYRQLGSRMQPSDLAAAVASQAETLIQNNSPAGVIDLLKRLNAPLGKEIASLARVFRNVAVRLDDPELVQKLEAEFFWGPASNAEVAQANELKDTKLAQGVQTALRTGRVQAAMELVTSFRNQVSQDELLKRTNEILDFLIEEGQFEQASSFAESLAWRMSSRRYGSLLERLSAPRRSQ